MNRFKMTLGGADLRSIGNNKLLIGKIKTQAEFKALFECLNVQDRIVVMRAADAIEKITKFHPELLDGYKEKLFDLCKTASHKELKWHLAQLLPRLTLPKDDRERAFGILAGWLSDKTNSKIVRVNALQGLYDLSVSNDKIRSYLEILVVSLQKENIASLDARIKKLKLRVD